MTQKEHIVKPIDTFYSLKRLKPDHHTLQNNKKKAYKKHILKLKLNFKPCTNKYK